MTTRRTKHEGLHLLGNKYRWRCVYCNCCVHCQICKPEQELRLSATRDHFYPKAKGGTFGQYNLVLSCWTCNNTKGDEIRLLDSMRIPSKEEYKKARGDEIKKHLTYRIEWDGFRE